MAHAYKPYGTSSHTKKENGSLIGSSNCNTNYFKPIQSNSFTSF